MGNLILPETQFLSQASKLAFVASGWMDIELSHLDFMKSIEP